VLGHLPVVAVFDTAFHHGLPPVAAHYALPIDLVEKYKLRRYGFHGISYRYVSDLIRGADVTGSKRLVVCHLGNGASACAILDGLSIDTSMGMTPLEGLVMGTRSGDVDPGLILFLEREQHIHMRELDRILNHSSGLAGLSGMTGDVRELEEAAAGGHKLAELALEVFAYRISKYIGAYAVALEGLDALAFCGGIGENSADMRRRICRRLLVLGIKIDGPSLPAAPSSDLYRIDSHGPVAVWVVKTDEERQIARETLARLA
jgi:acetate kinase